MGLALTALGGDLLPERTPRDAARLLAVRHAGIAAILAIAAPIAAHQLDVSTQTAKERGVALVLDAPPAAPGQDQARPGAAGRRRLRSAARRAAPRGRRRAPQLHRPRPRHLRRPRPEGRRHAGDRGRRGLPLVVPARRGAPACWPPRCWPPARSWRRWPPPSALALGTPAAYFALHQRHRARAAGDPGPVPPRADACPRRAGCRASSRMQALRLLDSTACKLGSSREELVLALADKEEAKRFEREHGVDPRTAAGLAAGAAEVTPTVRYAPRRGANRQEERQRAEYRR